MTEREKITDAIDKAIEVRKAEEARRELVRAEIAAGKKEERRRHRFWDSILGKPEPQKPEPLYPDPKTLSKHINDMSTQEIAVLGYQRAKDDPILAYFIERLRATDRALKITQERLTALEKENARIRGW